MATTIKVNGMTISVGNTAAASVESAPAADEITLAMRTAESAMMVDVMCKSLESVQEVFSRECLYSVENGFTDRMKKMGKSIKKGATKVWNKIIEFFTNLIQSIQAFVTSTALKLKAKSVLNALKKNGIRANWDKTSITVGDFNKWSADWKTKTDQLQAKIDALMNRAEKKAEAIGNELQSAEETLARLNGKGSVSGPAVNENEKMQVADALSRVLGKPGMKLTEAGSVSATIEKLMSGIASGSYDEIKRLLKQKQNANAILAKVKKLAQKGKDEDKNKFEGDSSAAVKAANLQVKLNNLKYRATIGQIQAAIRICSVIVKDTTGKAQKDGGTEAEMAAL